jgi:hypothetical protein
MDLSLLAAQQLAPLGLFEFPPLPAPFAWLDARARKARRPRFLRGLGFEEFAQKACTFELILDFIRGGP